MADSSVSQTQQNVEKIDAKDQNSIDNASIKVVELPSEVVQSNGNQSEVKNEIPEVIKQIPESNTENVNVAESSSNINNVLTCASGENIENGSNENKSLPVEVSNEQIPINDNELETEAQKSAEPEMTKEIKSQTSDNQIINTDSTEKAISNNDASENKTEILANVSTESKLANEVNDNKNVPALTQEEWDKRESELLDKISKLENQQSDNSNKGLKLQLTVKCEENDILRAKVRNLETELSAVLKKPNAKNKDIVSKIKKQHEELLTKAKGMIFDKTKMIKNQELQIEALTSQVSSLKEVVAITKNLLEIRNLEVSHLQERLEVVDLKIQAEKDRHNLMVKKIESGTMLNEQLKKEYETQLKLFKELKVRYEEKFRALEEEKNAPKTSTEETPNEPAT